MTSETKNTIADNIASLVESCLKYIPNKSDQSKLLDKTSRLITKYEQAHSEQNKSKIKKTNDDLYHLIKDIIRFLEHHQANTQGSYIIKDSNKYPEIKIADDINSALIKEYSVVNSLEKLVN